MNKGGGKVGAGERQRGSESSVKEKQRGKGREKERYMNSERK